MNDMNVSWWWTGGSSEEGRVERTDGQRLRGYVRPYGQGWKWEVWTWGVDGRIAKGEAVDAPAAKAAVAEAAAAEFSRRDLLAGK